MEHKNCIKEIMNNVPSIIIDDETKHKYTLRICGSKKKCTAGYVSDLCGKETWLVMFNSSFEKVLMNICQWWQLNKEFIAHDKYEM